MTLLQRLCGRLDSSFLPWYKTIGGEEAAEVMPVCRCVVRRDSSDHGREDVGLGSGASVCSCGSGVGETTAAAGTTAAEAEAVEVITDLVEVPYAVITAVLKMVATE